MNRLRRFVWILLEILREIGDERAYARHLARHRIRPSGAAWRQFSEERLRAKFGRPKCC
jgi:hypothetical protein